MTLPPIVTDTRKWFWDGHRGCTSEKYTSTSKRTYNYWHGRGQGKSRSHRHRCGRIGTTGAPHRGRGGQNKIVTGVYTFLTDKTGLQSKLRLSPGTDCSDSLTLHQNGKEGCVIRGQYDDTHIKKLSWSRESGDLEIYSRKKEDFEGKEARGRRDGNMRVQ